MDDYRAHGRHDLRDQAISEVASFPVTVPSAHQGWFRIEFPGPLELGEKDCTCDDDRLLIALSENPHIQWALAEREIEIAEMVEHSHHSPMWRSVGGMATMRLTPAPSYGEAANVTNGFHRRFGRGPTNMWISDPALELPQDLVLTWAEPQEFDQVDLTFDNLAEFRHEYPWECGIRVLPILAKAYELACWQDDQWHELAHEGENIHRFRNHRFAPVTSNKLRLRLLSAHSEGAAARVYQVRVTHSKG
jgi:hypothetical protein